MNKNIIVGLGIGLVIGIGGTLGLNAITENNSDVAQTTDTQEVTIADHSMMSMADMSKELEKLTGDNYDKAFIEMMIAHHEGAVDMAFLAETRAKHSEIKDLSRAIISAQEKEISQMRKWQSDWGYRSGEAFDMMHGGH